MRDISNFQTDYGIANLVLNQIPYTQCAYIHIVCADDLYSLLEECRAFCVACGAEKIYVNALGFNISDDNDIRIVEMKCEKSLLGCNDAVAVPVTDHTMEDWLRIYNEKMAGVDTAAYIDQLSASKICKECNCYFVYKEAALIGIGVVRDNTVECIASLCKGAGASVLMALCETISVDTVRLEVASTNLRAAALYERLGFVEIGTKFKWHRIN